jgi:2-keto-3-deoxy-L-rhamnonate aldolase RhmA
MQETPSNLRTRILNGETLFGSFVSGGSPIHAEIMARAGFDWLIVDLEHGAGTESELLGQLHAIGTHTTAIVRPQSAERLRIGRALDYGAAGVMIPRLETVAEVQEALAYLRYPPDGVRGLALATRGAGLGEVSHAGVAALNASIIGVFQVESPLAVDNAEEVASLDGVDVLFVGPADLSHAMGIPGQFDEPTFTDALRRVSAATERHGKAAAILLRSVDDVPRYLELGYRFIGIGSDLNFVIDAARTVVAAVRR